jgi:hypothetical protein
MEIERKLRIEEVAITQSDEQLKMNYEAVFDELMSDLENRPLSSPLDEDLRVTQQIMESEIIKRWLQSISRSTYK